MKKEPRTQTWTFEAMTGLIVGKVVTLYEKGTYTAADTHFIREGWEGDMSSMAGNWFDVRWTKNEFLVTDREISTDIRI